MKSKTTHLLLAAVAAILLAAALSYPDFWPALASPAAASDQTIYSDALAPGWQDWSWDTSRAAAATPRHGGAGALAVTHTAAWGGLYFHADPPVSTAGYTHLRFWIHGGPTGGQQIVIVLNGDGAQTLPVTAAANSWVQVDAALSSLGNPASISDIYWQDATGAAQPVYYLDDIALVAAGSGSGFPDANPDRQIDFPKSLAGVAVAPGGRLYVASWRESRIYSWPDAATAANPAASADLILGVSMDPEAPPGQGAGCDAPSDASFCGPEALVVDAEGNLYVAATYHNRVLVFLDPETDADPAQADIILSGFSGPRGLALDVAGNLYVVNEFTRQVLIFAAPLVSGMAPTTAISDQLNFPLGVAVDGAGAIYVADAGAGNVKRYDAPLSTDLLVDQSYSGFSGPSDLAFDGRGNLYVSDVVDFDHTPPNPPDSNDSRVAVVASPLTSTAIVHEFPGLAYPLGLAFDAGGSLYVAHCIGPYPCNGPGKLLVFDAPVGATPTPTPTSTRPATVTPTRTATPPTGVDVALSIDANADRRPISEDIYGIHYAPDEAFAGAIDLPVRRWGGNDKTRYNWQNDMFGNPDWYFENEYTPESADEFIAQGKRTGTDSIITIPMSGWVAKGAGQVGNTATYPCSYDTRKYAYVPQPLPNGLPARDPSDPNRTHCGSGITAYQGGQPVYFQGNDPHDTSLAIEAPFVASWVAHLKQTHGSGAGGGVKYYGLDNEPDIWFETHRDVYPVAWKYDEFRDLSYRYAAAIKEADPTALTLGPVSMGWTYYWHGSWDGQRQDWVTPDDRNAHGGTPFVPWYLQQMATYEAEHGVRLLDYLDLHFYPQNGVDLRDAGDGAMQALRLRSTRALWDATYVDESWIGQAGPDGGIVRLIPRMREWVDANYPGTKLAITEYNWGALDHINGGLAQADILGIFGREGLDLATLFDTPYGNGGNFTATSPGAYAFRMYRNYDGMGSKFGDVSVRAMSSDQGKVAAYAAQRGSDGALTVMVINKTGSVQTGAVTIANLAVAGLAQVYRYSAANLGAIMRLADQGVASSGFRASFPANSITLFVIPPTGGTTPTPTSTVRPPAGLYLPLLRR